MSVPRRLLVSASMWIAPVLATKVQFFRVTALAPGFTVPVRVLPSYLSSTVTGFLSSALGPQSPLQVPVNGSAKLALTAIAPAAKQRSKQTRETDFLHIFPPRNRSRTRRILSQTEGSG